MLQGEKGKWRGGIKLTYKKYEGDKSEDRQQWKNIAQAWRDSSWKTSKINKSFLPQPQ